MTQLHPNMAEQVAEIASRLQHERTGHTPRAVTVVMSENTLVITLHGALTKAEQAMAKTAAGATIVQEYHRQLFASSSDELRTEIKRITGVEVREAAAEIEPATGAVVHAFTSGTMVQVFLMAEGGKVKKWEENTSGSSPVEIHPDGVKPPPDDKVPTSE